MGRARVKHRYLSGVAFCAFFAALSNVRSSLDFNEFLRTLSDNDSFYPVIRRYDSSSLDVDEFESIDAPTLLSPRSRDEDYGSFDLPLDNVKNTTVWFAPRVVVLSETQFLPTTANRKDKNILPSFFGSLEHLLPIENEDFRMELPTTQHIIPSGKVYRKFEREWYEDCESVTKTLGEKDRKRKSVFQVRSTCNVFHELNMVEAYAGGQSENVRGDRIELLGEGSWRSVWKLITAYVERQASTMRHNISQYTPEEPELVLKLLLAHQKYDENSFSIHQVDAFVMEALSASDYIVDSFGFCGQSVITEAATSSGRSLIKSKSISTTDRLRIARDLARGLADLHTLVANHWDHHGVLPTRPLMFAHHDVNPANLISVGDGQIQWNDFNLGLINRQYATKKGNTTECPVPVRYEQLLWRSPEECQNRSGTLFLDRTATGRNTAAQAADVYSLGNILFYVLARHQPWSHLEEDRPGMNITKLSTGSNSQNKSDSLLAIATAKIRGNLPNLPERYLKRSGAKLLWEAVQMCYTHDPKLRPTAMEVADFLGKAYETMDQ